MKIGLLINSFNLGGAEKLIYDIAFELNKLNCDNIIISMKKADNDFEKSIEKSLNSKGIVTDTVAKPVKSGRIKAVFTIAKLVKKHNIDILHTNGQSPDFYGRMAKLFRKFKTVVTIHNTGGYSKKAELLLGGLTDCYTAVSKDAKAYSERELGIKKDITVIENGVDIEKYIGKKSEYNTFNIVSVGRFMPQKNYLGVIDGMNEFLKNNSNAKWYIVGDKVQDAQYVNAFSEKVDNTVKDRIILTGVVTNPESYYKLADCFLLPSSFEGFGIAFIEAMLAKLPVICNKVGVINDIAAAGGSFIDLSEHSVSAAIELAKCTPSADLDKNYEICKKSYSIQATTEKYFSIYERVMRN